MDSFLEFLQQSTEKPIDVLSIINTGTNYVAINLSKANNYLSTVDVSSSEKFSQYIESYLKTNNANVAYGGYLEKRNIYKRSIHFNHQDIKTERNIHLGLDLWCSIWAKVLAALDGEVHSFKNNKNHGDYGPTIILKHQIEDEEFYTLYGHLSLESMAKLKIGQTFKQGDCLGTLGDAKVNGDYPPHLHFQIIKDMQGFMGDYPGVCSQKDLEFYKTNCPNPILLLKL